MDFTPFSIELKNGRSATLCPPQPAKAAETLALLRQLSAETPYLLRAPEDWDSMTDEQEAGFLQANLDNPNVLMLLCEVDGRIVGVCDITFQTLKKLKHRGNLGICIARDYWGLGIGSHMFDAMIAEARSREGVKQVDLEFIEGNARARALYEKKGFRVVGVRPDAIQTSDGSLCNEYFMMLKL